MVAPGFGRVKETVQSGWAHRCSRGKTRPVDRPVLALDTMSLFFRAQHALPPMNTSGGEPTRALYGFSALLLKLLREIEPIGLMLALDAPQPTFRHERDGAYKGTRGPPPTELRQQWPRLEQIVEGLGVPAFRVPGFEADDILATVARRLREQGQPLVVVSGDRDLMQTALPPVELLFVGRRGQPGERYDRTAVEARFGVGPERLASYAALVGDNSDNISGVSGIGPRAAAKLVQKFGDVAGILAHTDAIEPPRLRELVLGARQQLIDNEALTRLRDDVPLPEGELYRSLGAAAHERLRAIFEELEFRSLLPRLAKLVS
jgi:DNA polymerase I